MNLYEATYTQMPKLKYFWKHSVTTQPMSKNNLFYTGNIYHGTNINTFRK